MLEIFFRYFFIIPLILLIITIVLVINGAKKLKHYEQCEGVITGFYESGASVHTGMDGAVKAIAPIVSYKVGSRQYEFTANFYATNMKVGQKIKVLYNSDDCSKAIIKTGIYAGPLISGVLALFFTIPVIVFAVLRSKGILNF